MTERFHVVPAELRGYGELLDRNAQHFLTIKDHAISKGGDTAGFTGLLSLLVPVVTGVAELYGETLDFANSKMVKEAQALNKTADTYEKVDALGRQGLEGVATKLDAAAAAPKTGGAR
ncbi:hypothetical protein [Goodfellowiella coeruleoviolacea]|uniref:ESX-1 secretion-associated protein n=1 Tax=Goodfellowiella coeruleoviolacea TaxID=334858 RepID=A0AAE3GAW5_9PSEU|nr:hypothetical protein [Goodfellowiella coeruleoviolacea]MCP2164912.1 hypothetical protein [Goodfellowiella coeruleoviolacea]